MTTHVLIVNRGPKAIRINDSQVVYPTAYIDKAVYNLQGISIAEMSDAELDEYKESLNKS